MSEIIAWYMFVVTAVPLWLNRDNLDVSFKYKNVPPPIVFICTILFWPIIILIGLVYGGVKRLYLRFYRHRLDVLIRDYENLSDRNKFVLSAKLHDDLQDPSMKGFRRKRIKQLLDYINSKEDGKQS